MNRKQVLAAVIGIGAVTTGAAAQNAVQWRVEDGGNGHWYRCAQTSVLGDAWATANSVAISSGGHLATVTSNAENQWVYTLSVAQGAWSGRTGPLLGGYKLPNNSFRWVTDEPWSFAAWLPGEPSSGLWEPYLMYIGPQFTQNSAATWNDTNALNIEDSLSYHYIVEWSADCNADGIVDYGQILAGELEDTNSNGVPDCCDIGASCDPCAAADIDGNGDVNGIDLAIILDKWGTNGGKDYPNADIDGDGTIAGADLAEVLGNWGACQ
jgi:hypothetical protein